MRDLFTGAVQTDPFGAVLLHSTGDPMLHYAGDPVVHQRGEDQLYLGGEPVFDENGNQVFTGSDPVPHSPDQAEITDRGQTVYDLVQADGTLVAINAPSFSVPSKTVAAGTTVRWRSPSS